MSETTKVVLGREVSSFDVSPQFEAYSGVEIVVDENTSYFAGNQNGRVLTIQNEWGTQAQANNILADLQAKGFQYQPYTASGAILNPAAEIGDGVTIADTYSGIYTISKNFGRLMKSDISAPQDEEVDHEFPFEPKQDRVYKREIAEAYAQIKINENSISAEVLRATNRENALQSSITQTATEISATVLKKSGGSSSSFGWTLTDSSWMLTSNRNTVFKADRNGVEVSGKITATSGKIGNFNIGASAIWNNISSFGGAGSTGVYLGTNGIQLGQRFKVDTQGNVTATRLTVDTLYIGGTAVSASTLNSRANNAYDWTSSNGSYTIGGASYGYNFNNATKRTGGSYPGYFRAAYLNADYMGASSIVANNVLSLNGYNATWKTATIGGQTITYLGR